MMGAAAPTFAIMAKDGRARVGKLVTRSGQVVDTPAILIYTRRGGPLSLTPDMLDKLKPAPQAFQLSTMHLYVPAHRCRP